MPKNLPFRCKVCRKSRRDGWHISRRGLCDECAHRRMVEAFTGPHLTGEEVSERVRLGWETRREREAAEGVGGPSKGVEQPSIGKDGRSTDRTRSAT